MYIMPHRPKKSKKTKQQKRLSRVMLRKKKQNEFEHLQYLKSQLDENGVPIDLLNTDEELLNNEQKFIIRLIKRLSIIDPKSLIEYINKPIDTKIVSTIIEYYNSNKENKSWIEKFFNDTYECLGFSNLYEYLNIEVPTEIIKIIKDIKMPEKTIFTTELENNILKECSIGIDLYRLDISELLNTLLIFDIQQRECCINQIDVQHGGLIMWPWFLKMIEAGIAAGAPYVAQGALLLAKGIETCKDMTLLGAAVKKLIMKKVKKTVVGIGLDYVKHLALDQINDLLTLPPAAQNYFHQNAADCIATASCVASKVIPACVGGICAAKTAAACIGAACAANVTSGLLPAACVGAACATGLI
jgi:hypothetical protein